MQAFCIVTVLLLKLNFEIMFWLIYYRLTIVPILKVMPVFAILGIVIPLIYHCIVAQKSIVNRFR